MPARIVPVAEPDIAAVASTIGDPVRALILMTLLDGTERPASELALRAGTSPSACTAHLKRLIAAGLIVGRRAGRHHFFRLASPDIGRALETLAAIAPARRIATLRQSTSMDRMRIARSCYDHLAGRLGVAVTEALTESGALQATSDGFSLGPRREVFERLGVDLDWAHAQRRAFARACLDWTERRPHIAGSIGAAIRDRFLSQRWVTRSRADRSLTITERGEESLERLLGIRLAR